MAVLLARFAVASALPEYSAAEAKKQIGENATVVGTIDCIWHGRRHVDLQSDHVATGSASQKLSDSQIKEKLLGYWKSPRHGYHIASDGIIYMCPRKDATTTNRWAVRDGKFYWDGEPHTIVTLNNSNFVYREIGGHGTTFTLIRGTKEEVDPD